MKIITYATHSEGTFEELTNSDVSITVLGWGTKWNGFMDKFKAVREFLDTQPDDEIVIFLDGFDSKINRDLTNLENKFRLMNCKVLVSHDQQTGITDYLPSFVQTYLQRRIFNTCKGPHTANTGLYMGYVKELKQVIESIQDGEDDQREFNSVCSQFHFIKVDHQNVIFQNCPHQSYKSDAYFVQYPGSLTTNRILRALQEYPKYFIPELIFVFLLLILIKF